MSIMKRKSVFNLSKILVFALLPYLSVSVINGSERILLNYRPDSEVYLTAVLSCQISPDYELQTVEAQAVIARSNLFRKFAEEENRLDVLREMGKSIKNQWKWWISDEIYEEAVENTPARIVETHFHGTGYQYRQSFLRGEIDYRKYDDIFPVAAVQEDLDIVWEILAGRMLMPYGVSDFAWMQYEGYVKQNQCEMMNYLKEEDQMPFINLMAEKNYFSKEGIEAAIDWASRKQKTELLSILMNEQHKRFPKKKKTFEL